MKKSGAREKRRIHSSNTSSVAFTFSIGRWVFNRVTPPTVTARHSESWFVFVRRFSSSGTTISRTLRALIHALVIAAHTLFSTLLTNRVTQHLLGFIRAARQYALIPVRRRLRLLLGSPRHISMTDRIGPSEAHSGTEKPPGQPPQIGCLQPKSG